MATKKTVTEVKEAVETTTEVTPAVEETPKVEEAPKKPEKVEVFIDRPAANEDPNFYVGLNGKTYILPKGQTSTVPPEIKKEIDRSRKAADRLDKAINKLLNQAK